MSQHTPGPWRTGRDGTVVCDAQHAGNHQMKEEDLSFYEGHLLAESISKEADARLMAAAPELAEALLDLCGLELLGHAGFCEQCSSHAPKNDWGLTGPVEHDSDCIVGRARAALKKAGVFS